MANFINFNGQLIPERSKILDISNRSFRYGDGIFESIFASKKNIPLIGKHFERLINGMETLSFDIPIDFTLDFVAENISNLLKHNGHSKGARVRFHVFRNGNGNYLPKNNRFSFIIESAALPNTKFQLNKEKIIIGVFSKILKPINVFSKFKTANSLIFIQAALWAQKNNFMDCLILNEHGFICEALFSNLFVVVDNHLTTPSISAGCVGGIMRSHIIKVARKNNYIVDEVSKLESDLLLHADEVLLTNAVSGIQSVLGFKKRRYYFKEATNLTELLNNSLGI